MIVKIYRGSNEIGGSCLEIIEGEERIVFDLGLPLIEKKESPSLLPLVEGLYQNDKTKNKVKTLFITHSHLDHCGLIEFRDENIPLFLGRATKDFIEISNLFQKKDYSLKNCEYIENKKEIKIGSFTITPFLLDHSAFDSYGFLIESKGKKVFYSGDFRASGRKSCLVKKIIKDIDFSVDALILEGTNINSSKEAVSETEIEKRLKETFLNQKEGTVFVITSSQNIDRFVSLYKATRKSKKTLVIDPYTALILDKAKDYAKTPYISDKFPYLKVFFSTSSTSKILNSPYKEKINIFKTKKIRKDELLKNKNNIVMIIRASIEKNLKNIQKKFFQNSLLIWSMWEGYKKIDYNKNFLQFLKERGVSDFIDIHTSGHADIETLRRFAKALNPKTIIPIHTLNPEKYNLISEKITMLKDNEEFEI